MSLKLRKNRSPAPGNICPLSKCLALLSGAWTPEIIWNLSAAPRRFTELRVDMPAISAKVLTTRLRHLEASGILARHVMPTSPPSVEYSLTALGAELLPAIATIAKVGDQLKFG
ncbi:helix-turn-helix transcriptional regulator [Paraburkholderia bengalensis]|uniref:Helix-turn-helix transcriptional regulator n=1 Tax=Paraburkholderia bengalensis TaxID=2747562 RepID=A0ABU8ITV1_9BURK